MPRHCQRGGKGIAHHIAFVICPRLTLAFQAPDAQIFRSQPAHYRMRAEFRIWHDEDDLYHIMFDPQTKARIRIDHFMPGSPLINALMTEMMTAIRPEPLCCAPNCSKLTTSRRRAVKR